MNFRELKLSSLLLSGLFLASCVPQKSHQPRSTPPTTKPVISQPTVKPTPKTPDEEVKLILPTVNREFRAAWIATVANINWPTKNNLSTDQQKAEAIRILDMLKNLNFNAVIFQARPSADALYKSDLEPWSYFLTGQTGRAPSPFYDPLEFWITEAHKRGMELHVWLNPYRAHHTTGGTVNSASMASKMSGETMRLRNGMYWMNPSDQKVQNHVSNVIKDLARRYDVDAIHIDDYFYPYKEYNGGADFPDSKTWNQYKSTGGTLSRADWRRDNVNKFIKRIHDEIKIQKPYVKFGISPFGIWKDKYPADVTGSSQYDELFADAKLWLNEGWCDYYSPQLYWREEGPQRFSSLLKWWDQENYKKIHLWPGLNTIGVKDVSNKSVEISNQIKTSRSILGRDAGVIHYSVDGISKNYEMQTSLGNLYKEQALIPASPWIKGEKILAPDIHTARNGNSWTVSWNSSQNSLVSNWILFTKYGGSWTTQILPRNQKSVSVPGSQSGKNLSAVALKAVDRNGMESEAVAQLDL